MKKFNFFLFCTLFMAVSCQSNVESDGDTEETLDSIAYEVEDTGEAIHTPPPPPDPTAKKDSIASELAKKSPFLNLGCCDEKEKSTDDCCCLEVLAKYKKMKEANDPKLGEYNMQDPILGNCKKKMREAFDKIDFPEPEDEENFDDLI